MKKEMVKPDYKPTFDEEEIHLDGLHCWIMSWKNLGKGRENGERGYDTCAICGEERFYN